MNPQAPKPPKDPNNHDLPKELQDCLRFLVDKYEKEDSWVRKQQIKLWKKNEEFWHGIQFIFWSESRQDWLTPTIARWFQEDEGREGVDVPRTPCILSCRGQKVKHFKRGSAPP